MKTITLTQIMNGAWKDRAIVTCEDRGIPQIADGLKPVQRFLIAQAYKTAKNNFDKVAAIASSTAALGYEHGEASAGAALSSMGAYFSNNLPFFEGDGSFGNVLDPIPAKPRYIYAKLASYIDDLLKDNEFAPENPDPEIQTPLYYLPIIPMVLVNGIKGIATGYATDIPPHSAVSIIDNMIRLTEGKDIGEIKPRYYAFRGTVKKESDKYVLTGIVKQKSPIKYIVTDLPPVFNTSASYEQFLRRLVDKGTIASYENNSSNDYFIYEIVLKKGNRWKEDDIEKNLKITSTHTWNLTTVMPDGHLHVWNKETGIEDIIRWFYDFRISFIQKRIDKKKIDLKTMRDYYSGFIRFIDDVINNKVNLKNTPEDKLNSLLKDYYQIPDSYIERVMNSPVRIFTTNRIEDLNNKLEVANKEIAYYETTTKEVEYRKDLDVLRKIAVRMETKKENDNE